MDKTKETIRQAGIAAIILNKDGDQLFTLYNKDRQSVSLPTGTIDPGEEPETTLVRELKEELDINVTQFEKVGVIEHCTIKGGVDIYYTTHVYKVLAFTGEIRNVEPHAHDDLKYQSIYVINSKTDEVLNKIVRKLQQTCLVQPTLSLTDKWQQW